MIRGLGVLCLSTVLMGADAPAFQEFALPNGLRVRVAENHELPILRVRMVIRPQLPEDPPEKPGLSCWLEAVLEQGGAGPYRSHAALCRAQEESGVALSFDHEPGRWTWDMIVDSRIQDQALEHLAHAVFRPLWDAATADRQRVRLMGALEGQDPGIAMDHGLQKLLGFERLGPSSSAWMKKLDVQDLESFRPRLLGPGKALLLLQGDLSLAQARQLVRLHFGTWGESAPDPEKPALQVPPPARSLLVEGLRGDMEARLGRALPLEYGPSSHTARLLEKLVRQRPAAQVPTPLYSLRWHLGARGDRATLCLEASAPAGAPLEPFLVAMAREADRLRDEACTATEHARLLRALEDESIATALHPERQMDRLSREQAGGEETLPYAEFRNLLKRLLDVPGRRLVLLGADGSAIPILEKEGFGPVDRLGAVR